MNFRNLIELDCFKSFLMYFVIGIWATSYWMDHYFSNDK